MDTSVTTRPVDLIWTVTNSMVTSRALHLVAEIGVADAVSDALPDSPVPVPELADRCGVDAGALDRVLRLLAAVGFFTIGDHGVAHNDASLLLCDGAPGSLRSFARMMGLPAMWTAVGAMDHTARTGRPGMEVVHPGGFFAHLADNAAEAAVFGAAMESRGREFAHAVVESYDFSPFSRVVDVAGGRGHLLASVLDAEPLSDGILFEVAPVAALALSHERLTTVVGDVFADPLPAGDAYLLMEVLHDWPDPEALEILRAIRRACRPGSVVLVIESVVPDDRLDARVHNLDVLMLVITGGRERTVAEFRGLLDDAGFQLTSITETSGPMRVVEAIAV